MAADPARQSAPTPAPAPAPAAPQQPAEGGFPKIVPSMVNGDWADSDVPGYGIPGRPGSSESIPDSMNPALRYAADDDPEIIAKRHIRDNLDG